MRQIISVITAVHEPSARFLDEAYASLVAQELPAGWDWQWVVRQDGEGATAADLLPASARIDFSVGRSAAGVAVARNMALSRTTGSLVKVLDSDDRLMPGVLARDIHTLTEFRQVGWTTSAVLDLMPDGSTVSWQHADPPGGVIARGDVLRSFVEQQFRLPVHPATLCMRRELAFALGGWMALPGGEDTGLLLAASVVREGFFLPEPGLLYRKWPGQATSQPDFAGTEDWSARMALIEARAHALSADW